MGWLSLCLSIQTDTGGRGCFSRKVMKKIKSVKDNVVIGIDPSISSTGYCVRNRDTDEVLKYGIIHTSKETLTHHRITHIQRELIQICEEFRPKNIVIEGLSFGSGGQSTRDLAGLFHVLINTFMEKLPNNNVYVISPKTLKKRFAGHGKASKEEMHESLQNHHLKLYNEVFDIAKSKGRFDIVDAYALSKQVEQATEQEKLI